MMLKKKKAGLSLEQILKIVLWIAALGILLLVIKAIANAVTG